MGLHRRNDMQAQMTLEVPRLFPVKIQDLKMSSPPPNLLRMEGKTGLLFCLVVSEQRHFVINQQGILDKFYLQAPLHSSTPEEAEANGYMNL